MKIKLSLTALAATISAATQAQNLLANGSFETNLCPALGATTLTVAGQIAPWAYTLNAFDLRRKLGSQHLECKLRLAGIENTLSQTEVALPGVSRQLVLADVGGLGSGVPRTASLPYNVGGSWGTFSFPAVTLATQQAPATHTRAEFHAKPAASLVKFLSTDPVGVVLDNVYAIPTFSYPKEPAWNLAGISAWNDCATTLTITGAVVGSPEYHAVRAAADSMFMTVASDPSHQGGLILIGNYASGPTLSTKLVLREASPGSVYARVYYYGWVNKRWWLRDTTPILTLAQNLKFGLQQIPAGAFGALNWTATPVTIANFVNTFGGSSYVVAKVIFTRNNGTLQSPTPTAFSVDVDQARIN